MNVKYYHENISNNKVLPYMIFHNDGTGECVYPSYSIYFKYVFIDKESEVIACFYNGISDKSQDFSNTTWRSVITVSKNVMRDTSGTVYINENYLKELPHFGE